MALFEVFAREKRELTKSEVARMLDMPESSCSDLLNTLYELGYVSRTANTKRYYPTTRLLSTATLIAENDALSLFGAEATSLLGQRVNETCTFGVIDNDKVKILSVYEGTHRLRYVVNVGDRVSLHGTAVGKALLAALPEPERFRLLRLQPLRRLTDNTKVDVARLEDEIAENQARGWFSSHGEGAPGVWSLAVAGNVGNVPVAISMIGPESRLKESEEKFAEAVLQIKDILFNNGADTVDGGAKRPRGRPKSASVRPVIG